MKNFQSVSFLKPPYKSLFSSYLSAYGCKFSTLKESKLRSSKLLPFGVFLQIFITLLSIPILIVGKRRIVLFTGDKFEKNKEFSNKISQGYRKLAKKKGWKVVNASQSKNDVHNDVMKVVAKKMGL